MKSKLEGKDVKINIDFNQKKCILNSRDQDVIRNVLGEKDLDTFCKRGKKLDEIKIFVTEKYPDGQVVCVDFFLEEIWKQCDRLKNTFENRKWTGCALLYMLKCQEKPFPKDAPSWAW